MIYGRNFNFPHYTCKYMYNKTLCSLHFINLEAVKLSKVIYLNNYMYVFKIQDLFSLENGIKLYKMLTFHQMK